MDKLTSLEVFVNCGFKADLFRKTHFETGDSMRIKRLLTMAIQARAMISVVGDRGIGKTTAIQKAMSDVAATVVYVGPADKERVTVGDIEREMIMSLSDENPKTNRVVRARQLRRIIGSASGKKEIVLIIEESHRISSQTLRSIKTLREMEWMGAHNLFTVVFAGQSDPMNRPGVSEVRLRSDSVYMKGMGKDEIAEYIRATVGRVFEEDAIEMITGRPGASNFKDLKETLVNLMGLMLATGRGKVDAALVAETLDMGRTPIPKGRRNTVQDAGISKIDTSAAGSDALKSVMATRMGGPSRKVVNG
ncbi:MAG: ATP-binding protein [Pseudomonadota bacterium]